MNSKTVVRRQDKSHFIETYIYMAVSMPKQSKIFFSKCQMSLSGLRQSIFTTPFYVNTYPKCQIFSR